MGPSDVSQTIGGLVPLADVAEVSVAPFCSDQWSGDPQSDAVAAGTIGSIEIMSSGRDSRVPGRAAR